MRPKRKNVGAYIASKKRARFDVANTPSPISLQSKSATSEPSAISLETATPAPGKANAAKSNSDEDHEWEILDNDTRDPLKVSVVEPHRLTVRFRNRITGEVEKPHVYSTKAENIDWHDKQTIRKTNAWRRQLFNRKKFPPKVEKNQWAPLEVAYLELMYEKLTAAADADAAVKLPSEKKILEAYNELFEDRHGLEDAEKKTLPPRPSRNHSQLTSFMRRPGTTLRVLRERVKNRLKDKSKDAWIPRINEAELETYLSNKTKEVHESLAAGDLSKAASTRLTTDLSTTVEPASPIDGNQEQAHGHPRSSKIIAGGDIPRPNAVQEPVRPPQMPEMANPDANKGDVDQVLGSADPKLCVSGPSVTDTPSKKPRWMKPRWVKPLETAVIPTPPDVIANLKARPGIRYTVIPKTDEEALQKYREEYERKQREANGNDSDASWMGQATSVLNERLKERGALRNGQLNEVWNRDDKFERNELIAEENEVADEEETGEDWHEYGLRKPGAAAVNGALNLAILPPVGYSLGIRDLVEKRLLPDGELKYHEISEAAREKVEKAHDKAFKPLRDCPDQRDIDENSDEITDEGNGVY